MTSNNVFFSLPTVHNTLPGERNVGTAWVALINCILNS